MPFSTVCAVHIFLCVTREVAPAVVTLYSARWKTVYESYKYVDVTRLLPSKADLFMV